MLGECSVCGLQDELTIVQMHFNETHGEDQADNDLEIEQGEGENLAVGSVEKNIWSHECIMLLLDEYSKLHDNFRNSKYKKKLLWEKISSKMTLYGYNIEPSLLDQKLRNLKCTYNKIKENNSCRKTGRGRVSWPYFETIDKIFQLDKTVNLPYTISSDKEKHIDSDSSSTANVSEGSIIKSVTEKRLKDKRNLDAQRKRQLSLEEEKLVELKKIRLCVEESNRINKEKLESLKDYIKTIKENMSCKPK